MLSTYPLRCKSISLLNLNTIIIHTLQNKEDNARFIVRCFRFPRKRFSPFELKEKLLDFNLIEEHISDDNDLVECTWYHVFFRVFNQ